MTDDLPKYCPHCGPDPISDGDDVKLDEYQGVLYCNATGEGGCGFHYDVKTQRRFRYKDKPFLWFWVILCLLTFFNVETQYRDYTAH